MELRLTVAAAFATALCLAPAVEASTFAVEGGDLFTLCKDYNPSPGTADIHPGTTVLRNAALSIEGRGYVTFSYVGAEAGYQNQFWAAGLEGFDNKAASNAPFKLKLGPGVVPFDFRTVSPSGVVANGASKGFYKSIALFQTSSKTVYALFNDSAKSDKDYDDIVVRMDVAPVPLPAAAWLLVGGLGGLGAVARRRKTA